MTGARLWLREIGHGVAFLGLAVLAGLLLLDGIDRFDLDALSPGVRMGLGGVALGAAVYFLMRVAGTARSAAPIRTMGSGGPIGIAPEAVREFVRDLLEADFEVDDARVTLRAAGEGIKIFVHFALPPDQRVPELAERIQNEVRRRVEERIGVTVDQVDVTAQAFKPAASSPAPAESTTSDDPTPSDLPEERDRVD